MLRRLPGGLRQPQAVMARFGWESGAIRGMQGYQADGTDPTRYRPPLIVVMSARFNTHRISCNAPC